MKKRKLWIGKAGRESFSVPVEFVTETAGILARKGAGKTYTAQVIAEELLEAKQQIVAIDPLNAWWGLRSGYKVVIFGGPKGDMPLEKHMGKTIADLVAENPGLSCVLSLRHMRKSHMRQFVCDFADQLFHRKGETKLATPVHLFIDEADLFAPQRVTGDVARLVGAMEDLVRRGRQAGIGVTMITQRSASLNKDVLTQIEVLVAGQITGPQDKKAIKSWIEENADEEEQGAFMASLAKLKVGVLWFWSPSFLDVLVKVNVRKKRTFDSSATPKAGKRQGQMKAKPVDLESIRTTLADTIKEAEEKDPNTLKRRIVELERKLKQTSTKESVTVVEHAGFSKGDVEKEVKKAVAERDDTWKAKLDSLASRFLAHVMERNEGFKHKIETLVSNEKQRIAGPSIRVAERAVVAETKTETRLRTVVTPPVGAGTTEPMSKSDRRVLTALAQRGRPCTRRLVAIQSGYSLTSGGFGQSLARLRQKGWLVGGGGAMQCTQEGLEALGPFEPLPTGDALIDFWKRKLPTLAARRVFEAIALSHPVGVNRESIAFSTGYSMTSGGFGQALATLRGLELIVGTSDGMKLSSEMFE